MINFTGMHLQNITVLNFKNYREAELVFSPGVNAFTGNNGSGKTNLLDAIHYLSLCKSYFNPIDSQQIKQHEEFFMVQGVFDKEGQTDTISCGLKRNQKKQFRKNKKDYLRLADHIGQYPLVMISPYDVNIIMDGSEERRKFIDNVISQTDSHYLDELIVYQKNLLNRNALLKSIAEKGKYDPALMDILDERLINAGIKIFQKRKEFMEVFTPVFNKHYLFISEGAEVVNLQYESQLLTDDFAVLLEKSKDRDRFLERTNVGIHKDDLLFNIHELPLKKFGSQGQQKSFLIALKLAQYSFLFQKKGFKPLLLLDDIFDKLDDLRIKKLMQMVSEDDFGQIFITDTSRQRIAGIFNDINVTVNITEINKGEISHEQN